MTDGCNQTGEPSSGPAKPPTVEHTAQPWQVLGRFLAFQSPNHKLWWDKMAPIIGSHLKGTDYSTSAQYQHLLMVHSKILPTLGPFPNPDRTNLIWPSCLPGGGEPWEISVNYQQGSKSCFRVTVEPIGPNAGTERDPLNETSARQLLNELSRLQPNIDFGLFNYFDDAITLSNRDARKYWDSLSQHWDALGQHRDKPQKVIALDLHEGGSFTVKPYFISMVRSIATGVGPVKIMLDSAKSYWKASPLATGLSMVDDYLAATKHPLLESKSFLSVDCKDPKISRVKIYTGANITSLDVVYDFWSLGGCLQGNAINAGFEIVKRAWETVFPKLMPNGKAREYMTFCWNWEVSPSHPDPVPKAYFLLSDDYDKHVTDVVVALFKDLGWDSHIARHKRLQEEACLEYDFETGSRVYTWIAIAFSEKTGPYITVYGNFAAAF
ncbi:aromatic prenyltransferase [Arthroderma uncinatum]|uniref:aromatic prenyltransferase n=1 Tax=Arthroderma uncinatum TaxID=74035 RepID=UPI00144ACEFB|nr:aromatic prenyltransferase [Arthroderma uncinatum]KAF3483040.1 aromatic prenyltransferase [Arthroderma uncinatum]